MKKLFILLGLFICVAISAQIDTQYLRKGGSFSLGNTAADTLTASTTLNYLIVLPGEGYGVMTLAVESDSVSGTSAYSAYLQKSLKPDAVGDEWINVDTVAHTGGADDYGEFDAVNATHTYWRISFVSTAATQKSNLKIWGRLNEGFVIEN
jgi:hypothetical protein